MESTQIYTTIQTRLQIIKKLTLCTYKMFTGFMYYYQKHFILQKLILGNSINRLSIYSVKNEVGCRIFFKGGIFLAIFFIENA